MTLAQIPNIKSISDPLCLMSDPNYGARSTQWVGKMKMQQLTNVNKFSVNHVKKKRIMEKRQTLCAIKLNFSNQNKTISQWPSKS